MDFSFEQKIRQRAYEIWMAAGMVDGAAEEHWLLAQDDILNETQAPTAEAAPGPAKAKSTRAAPKGVAKPKEAKPRVAKPKIDAAVPAASSARSATKSSARAATKSSARATVKSAQAATAGHAAH